MGAHRDDDNGSSSGSAYLFRRDAGGVDNWGEVTKLLASDGAAFDLFGQSVAVSGDTVVVAARSHADNGTNSGSAYLFRRDEGGVDNWGQVTKLLASDGATGDVFGTSVAVSGATVLVGARLDDDNGSRSGSAYVFRRDEGGADNWGQVTKLLASDGAGEDRFGFSVAVWGATAVVGARFDDDNGSNSGSAYVFPFDFAIDCTDNDGDGFGSPGDASCGNGAAEDCNDSDSRIFPGASEVCDAVDNDCNAVVDDVATTCGVGVCAGNVGLLSCVTLVDSCDPLAGATAEVCDSLDNDCNALVDDGIVPVASTCGVGVCTGNVGLLSCVTGALVDSCDPLAGATAEVCDSLDNDCNAVVDDNIAAIVTGSAVGECQSEIQSCIDGAFTIVQTAIGPATEFCDSLDNDCSGVVDDNIATIVTGSAVGECQSEIQSCIGGAFTIVQTAIGPATEFCDGLDNDCNAVVDDGELNISANTHTVGAGTHPGSTKDPLAGIVVCAYDKSEGSCSRDTCGGISHQHYQCIVDSCGTDDGEQIFCCTTDDNGECAINAPPGDYIAISDDATKTTLPDPLGVSASDLVCQEVMQKHLQQIVKADGKKVPGKTSRRTGSELLVIEPEFIEWTGSQELYPFVFETVGDWEVTTAVTPPEGFVSDYDVLAELVVNEVEAVQFTITDIGSDWVPTEARHTVSHNGRRQVILSRVGVKLASDLAQQKGLDSSGHVLGQNGKPVSQAGFDPRAPRDCEIVGWVEPSPTDPNWTFKLRVDVATYLTLQITRGQGLVVETLATGTFDPGEHEFTFDGGSLGSGRYFVTLVCGDMVQSVFLVEE